jgi:hypothetical protein
MKIMLIQSNLAFRNAAFRRKVCQFDTSGKYYLLGSSGAIIVLAAAIALAFPGASYNG